MSSYTSLVATQKCKRSRLFRNAYSGVNKISDAFIFGSAYHESIQHNDINVGIDYLKQRGMENQIELLKEMYDRFQRFIARLGIEILENEIEFHLELDGRDFQGKIDAIVRWNGDIYLAEFKTAKALTIEHIDADAQITTYLLACDRLNQYNPKGLLWIGNKKAIEKEPVILKNGNLSTAKNQGVTLESYKAKVKEVYGDDIPENISSYMKWLELNSTPYIAMVRTTRTPQQLQDCENTICALMKEEKALIDNYKEKGLVQAVRECACLPDKVCMTTCPYKELCIDLFSNQDLTDDDVKAYIDGLKS